MPNQLFNLLGGGNMQANNPMKMIQEFINFKNNFKGDPREEVNKLLQSGKMTQAQLDQLQGMANQFQGLLSQFKF